MLNQLIQQGWLPIIGTWILLFATGFDFILSHDDFPHNSVREWLLSRAQRSYFSLLSGAFVPYGLGLLVGHFYHFPGARDLLSSVYPEEGRHRLVTALIIGVIVGVLFRFVGQNRRKGGQLVPWIALFGIIVGMVIWPVG